MDISEIKHKNLVHYFVWYVEDYHKNLAIFIDDPGDVESFVTGKKKDDETFDVICIVRGKLVDIKPTQVETCWKIQE